MFSPAGFFGILLVTISPTLILLSTASVCLQVANDHFGIVDRLKTH